MPARKCPKCGSGTGRCPECGTLYTLGARAHCPLAKCKSMNAPIDCDGCGLTVCSDLSGVLALDGTLIKWRGKKA